jgi:hypothetical protein
VNGKGVSSINFQAFSPTDLVTSYSKSWTGLKIDPSPIQTAVQCNSVQVMYGSCKSVLSHLFRNLYKLAVLEGSHFPSLPG